MSERPDYDAHHAANVGREQALRSLEEAWRRGTIRSKTRQLEVVCRGDHRLAEVFPSGHGPLAIAQQRRYEASPDAPVYGPHKYVSRGRVVVTMLAGLADQQVLVAECACTEARIPVGWLRSQLARKRRRVVAPAA